MRNEMLVVFQTGDVSHLMALVTPRGEDQAS
jgi:hypothetical protein